MDCRLSDSDGFGRDDVLQQKYEPNCAEHQPCSGRELADEKLGETLPVHSDVHKTLQDRLKDRLASIGLPGLEKDAAQIVLSIHDIVDKRYKDQLAISEYRMITAGTDQTALHL